MKIETQQKNNIEQKEVNLQETQEEKFVKLLYNEELIAIGLKTGNQIKPKTVLN